MLTEALPNTDIANIQVSDTPLSTTPDTGANNTPEIKGDDSVSFDIFENDNTTPAKTTDTATQDSINNAKKGESNNDAPADDINKDQSETDADDSNDDSNDNQNDDKQEKEKVDTESKQQPPTSKQKRDYSKFTEEDQALLRKLPNSIYDKLKVRLQDIYEKENTLKELQEKVVEYQKIAEGKGVPENWHESPDAYTLTPEYRSISDQFDKVAFEEDHWRQQLTNVKSGQPITPLQGYDKDGNPVYGAQIESQPQHEVALLSYLQNSALKKQQLQQEATAIQTNFINGYKQAHAFIDVAKNKFNALPKDLQPKKEHIDSFMSQIPAAYKNNPAMQLAAAIYSVAVNQEAMIKALRANSSTVTKNNLDAKRAGPRIQASSKATKTSANSANDIVDMDELDRLMQS